MRTKLAKNILNLVSKEQLFHANDSIVVAISGGIDSTALLHLLAEIDLNLTLYAVYIDHQLRPAEVPAEISHVRNEAENLGITFISKTVDTINYQVEHKLSQEEAARILRYNALKSISDEYQAKYIAVGHTADDQVEEFFLRLIKGSGKCGLSGMLFKQEQIIRPLLKVTKKQLRDYLQNKNIGFCKDSSNTKRLYTRNRVRLDLLPLLESFNPSIGKTILNTGTILQEEEDLLQSLCHEQYDKSVQLKDEDNIEITLMSFEPLHPALKRRIIEKLFWSMGRRPTYTIIDNILLFINNSISNKTLTLEGGLRLTKIQNKLHFHFPFGKNSTSRQKITLKPELRVVILKTDDYNISSLGHNLQLEIVKYETAIQQAESFKVDYDKLTFPLIIRYQKDGERFQPINGNGSKKINRFLSEKKISLGARIFHPLLVNADDEIISVLGLAITDKFKVTSSTQKIMTISWKSN